jgi:hypothetical protein
LASVNAKPLLSVAAGEGGVASCAAAAGGAKHSRAVTIHAVREHMLCDPDDASRLENTVV